jgi:hypothetical protein
MELNPKKSLSTGECSVQQDRNLEPIHHVQLFLCGIWMSNHDEVSLGYTGTMPSIGASVLSSTVHRRRELGKAAIS